MTVALGHHVPGMVVVACLAAGTVALVTAPGRARLDVLRTEAISLAEKERDLTARLSAIQAQEGGRLSLPPGMLWGQNSAKPVELALQEALVAAAGTAGLQLVSFGQAASPQKTSLPTVAFELELTGTHDGVAQFLAEVEAMEPSLAVSYLWLRQLPPDPGKAGAPLGIRLTVWGFRGETKTP